MSQEKYYKFGPFVIDVSQSILLCDGKIVQMTPKAFQTLLVLVENSPKIVTKEELLEKIWPDEFVEEGSLSRNIWTVRKTLGEESSE